MLGVVQGGVAAGVDPVDDGPHGGLDVGAGVAQQHEHRLLVVAAAGLAVHHDLVVVARLDQTNVVLISVSAANSQEISIYFNKYLFGRNKYFLAYFWEENKYILA